MSSQQSFEPHAASAAQPLDLAAPWGAPSRSVDLDGPVHYVDFGGPDGCDDPDAPSPVVLVHGLGGSHLNWVGIGPALARTRRVVALDLAGFGLTPSLGRSTSVHHNAALLSRFVHRVLGRPAVLVGNSMGGMVSLLLADRRPEQVAGLGLIDPALPIARQRQDPQVAATFALYAVPRVGEAVLTRYTARYSDRQRVLGTIALCFADPSRADDDLIGASVQLAAWRRTMPAPEADFLGAARSLLAVLRRPRRYDALIAGIDRPVLLVHGEDDRLVPVAAARRTATLNPSWRTAYLDGVGHTPQLEVPGDVLGVLEPWLDSVAT
ncbi:alpha/beta fold hydrolase [Humibacillus xanthopallidus]|uniref:Pimeloyl-ACP methyl ester carboxylesterase n=1 Tax=Humibacillus xanthopallidus TaxID=412689 RepID=A0A543HFW4_9MICO|nr:alpha/beta fold hydrolase [Humibacillus xanthopallidus]TQM57228.1 pimeloyl-ACP methyl ester carboxylesterase [Humibacillus xanthopallidus]